MLFRVTGSDCVEGAPRKLPFRHLSDIRLTARVEAMGDERTSHRGADGFRSGASPIAAFLATADSLSPSDVCPLRSCPRMSLRLAPRVATGPAICRKPTMASSAPPLCRPSRTLPPRSPTHQMRVLLRLRVGRMRMRLLLRLRVGRMGMRAWTQESRRVAQDPRAEAGARSLCYAHRKWTSNLAAHPLTPPLPARLGALFQAPSAPLEAAQALLLDPVHLRRASAGRIALHGHEAGRSVRPDRNRSSMSSISSMC